MLNHVINILIDSFICICLYYTVITSIEEKNIPPEEKKDSDIVGTTTLVDSNPESIPSEQNSITNSASDAPTNLPHDKNSKFA